MTQKEKDLLLQDLCWRLPYKQKVCYKIHTSSEEITETLSGALLDYFKTEEIKVVKPYLRPMSSMTEEEKEYVKNRWCYEDWSDIHDFLNNYEIDAVDAFYLVDWMTANHFDYRGLIGKGLALPAPEGMYNN